jgi:hypothetical protein
MLRQILACVSGVAMFAVAVTAYAASTTTTVTPWVPAPVVTPSHSTNTGNVDSAIVPAPRMYAILVGSQAPSDGVSDAIRGDLDVDRMAAQLSWATTITLKYRWNDIDSVASDIQAAATTIAGKLRSGDSFMFYYSGHGTGGPGLGVQDFINPVKGLGYQDNTLTSVFANSAYAAVNKLFLIDSCYAEGMWKNDSQNDADLQTLSKISFLGSSSEDGVAYADPNANGTGFLTNAILPSLTPQSTFASVLAEGLAVDGLQVAGFFKGETYGMGKVRPVGGWSADFDLNQLLGGQTVPEPASLVLLGCVASGLFVWRRRTW